MTTRTPVRQQQQEVHALALQRRRVGQVAAAGVWVVMQIDLRDQRRDVGAEPDVALRVGAQDPPLGVVVAQRPVQPSVQAARDLTRR